jgi:predicted ferric reductase
MDPHFYWYVVRAAGVVTFGLLTFSTALGLCISARLGGGFFERPWVYELHKFSALLALGFLGIHVAILLPDPWTQFRVVDVIVPGTSAYRPLAVAAGVLAMYGALVGTFSFYIKGWIGQRAWRLLHYTTFLTFALAIVHGTLSGADTSQAWMRLLYAGAGMLVAWLTVLRFFASPRASGPARRAEALFTSKGRVSPGVEG